MTIQRMIELLKIEHECMLRGAHDDCDRNCADCELVQDDGELHEMYTNVIGMLKEQEARVLTLDEAAADQEVWTEAKLRGTERIPLFISILWLTDDAKDFELELIGTSRRAFMLANEYGKTWRCWSSKPTDEQRKAVKW